jgi:hypothetical protein
MLVDQFKIISGLNECDPFRVCNGVLFAEGPSLSSGNVQVYSQFELLHGYLGLFGGFKFLLVVTSLRLSEWAGGDAFSGQALSPDIL